MAAHVLALVRDLILRSRVEAAAEAAGVEVVFASTYERLRLLAAEAPITTVFADLSDASFDPETTARELIAACPRASLIGFASHVDLKPLATARAAGFAQTLSRSEFVSRLPTLLKAQPDPPAS
jgi:DNA-binding NarL/FixJ family response regulator